ncbi:MAG: ABC transporter permease [Chloroflexi bacterium]|nr:ABC transporter permease [Chloroflexota bacterium]
MKTVLTVIKHEFLTVVLSRSFLLMLFLVPLSGLAVMLFTSYVNRDEGENAAGALFAPEPESTVDGYVDQSGLVTALPAGMQEMLIPFVDEASAEKAMEAGEIDGYYVIPVDYLETGSLQYVQSQYNPYAGLANTQTIETAINFNLLNQDQALADRIENPLVLQTELLGVQSQRDPENAMTFVLPYIVTFLFYFVIFGSASLMLNNLTNEKQNRMIEILMTSISPLQMLTGKIIALGLVGLLQTVVWSTSGLLILRLGGRMMQIGDAFQLDVSILVWGVLFFVAGYALYASFMAGVGALVPNLKEASQATFVIMIPLLVPLMLIEPMVSKPNGTLAMVLSLFPLTSPVSMMTRLAATEVPYWQIWLALLLVILTAYLVIRGVAGLFRAQYLLTGQKFSLGRMLRAMTGKA